MIKKKWMGIALALGLMAACDVAGGFGGRNTDPRTAPGIATDQAFTDGLLVGHRLMAAGEYELALKSYFRAGAEQGLNVDVLSALGSVNLKLGRLGQAETLLRRAIAVDETFPPAWNNLGVVLMEQGNYAEAERVFRTAFALDSGESVEIRDNLRLALEKIEPADYPDANYYNFALVRRGPGDYLLLSTP
ncbi:MAG: tetratricopeptide repeat protein [Paracoccaceae bacterium]